MMLRGHGHITVKYRSSAHRDCSIILKLDHKIPVVFLRNYGLHLIIILELGKFNVKINVIPNGLEKYKGFTINNVMKFVII